MDCRTKLLQNSDRIYNPRQQTEAILYTCFAAPYISDAELDTSTALSVPLLRNALGGICQKSHRFRCSFSTRLLRRFGVVPVCKSCMHAIIISKIMIKLACIICCTMSIMHGMVIPPGGVAITTKLEHLGPRSVKYHIHVY